jgi:uncharacterized membrane protein YbjE (DUF340 family)
MNDEEIRKIIDSPPSYDDSRGDSYMSMVRDFYSRRMLSTAILVWVFAIVFFAGATYCGVQFLHADQTKLQIMYASLFICFVHGIGLMKIFAWQMVNKISIRREIKTLELRIAELTGTVKGK